MESLDKICAEYGFKIAEEVNGILRNPKETETLITKALAVLQEQGLYAFSLFCKSRSIKESEGAKKIEELIAKMLKDRLKLIGSNDLLKEIREGNERDKPLSERLDDLFLAIEVTEKTLIYARYHAKALKVSQGRGGE